MKIAGMDFSLQHVPELDAGFVPLEAFFRRYLREAEGGKPLTVAIHRNGGLVSVFPTRICGTSERREADKLYIEKLVKFLLWQKGGQRVTICGDDEIAAHIRSIYRDGGTRDFDFYFMEGVYEAPFSVDSVPLEKTPKEKENPQNIGRHLEGCRIGFDAGGSDRKVSAVMDGQPVYSEEVVWFPKEQTDPDYHYQGILEAFRTAASKLPRVDAIGVSSAGIYINNRTMVASLFIKVPKEAFNLKAKDIYIRAAKELEKELGMEIPLIVANDGDVTALAGAMSLEENNVLGIAMGTSEAVGFVNKEGNITGWLNELAFAPVDLQPGAPVDEWSLDFGVGCKYFSQDAVIRLAAVAGIDLTGVSALGDKLKKVQELMQEGRPEAAAIYRSMGCYLGHTLPLYYRFYGMKHVLLMGRVTSGEGGNIIVEKALEVLRDEYPEVSEKLLVQLPSEKSRRVGQSIAAASLPKI